MIQCSFRVAFGFTVLGLAAFGCDSDSSRDAPPAVKRPFLEAPRASDPASFSYFTSSNSEPRLIGSWKSACEQNEDGTSGRLTLDISPQYILQTHTLYTVANCMEPALDARYISSYTADEVQLQTTSKQAHVRIRNFSDAQAAQAGLSCGYNVWQTDVWYDLTDRACAEVEEGFWLTATESGTRDTAHYSMTVTGAMTELDLGEGVVLSRPTRAGDRPSPATDFLFANRNAQRVETLLKNSGCTLSLELGVSDCPQPRNLKEASQLVDQLIEFGNVIGSDPNFSNKEAAQARLRKGYNIEFEKVKAFPAYAEVHRSVEDSVKSLGAAYPEFKFSTLTHANALRLIETVKTLESAFETLDLVSELRRLNVTTIVVSISRSYQAGQKDVYLFWDDLSTPAQLLAYLKLQTPKVLER